MQRRTIRRGLSIAASATLGSLLIGLGTSVTAAAPAGASCPSAATTANTPVRHGSFLGIVPKAGQGGGATCANATVSGAPSNESAKFKGRPPLIDNGGPAMGAIPTQPGNVKVIPVYWDPSATLTTSFKRVIDHYVRDIAADNTGLTDAPPYTNVYSVDLQLSIHYDIHNPGSKADADAFPANGCTPDTRAAYSDSSTYTHCFTDAQLQAELSAYLTANAITPTAGDLYVMMLPKGVESCMTSTDGRTRDCSTPWAGGFCGYHSFFNGPNPPIYADIPFPSYNAPGAPFTCAVGFLNGVPSGGGVIQSPNGNLDADVVVSTVSHEINEAITDPYGTKWTDSQGFEIGDECAYIYGTLAGTSPAQYNQTINGDHYLTQEEASNENFLHAKRKPCVQSVDLPTATVKVKPKTPKVNALVTFIAKKAVGENLAFSWNFGDGSLPALGQQVTHTYTVAGPYTVTLTVTDNVNLQHSSLVLTDNIVVAT